MDHRKIFCDFGPEFVVSDTNGEAPLSCMIASITQDADGIVTCLDETRHGFEDGDFVTLSEVQGMTELNDGEPRKITVVGPYSFKIGSTADLSDYVRGGVATQVKMPKSVQFKPLAEATAAPEVLLTDFAKMERPNQLHLGFQALDAFKTEHGRFPQPGSSEDGAAVIALANGLKGDLVDAIDEKLLATLASQATGHVAPLDAVIGGIAAQEVMKACSGKFSPIMQYLYFDSLESLPAEAPDAADLQPTGSRYDGQTAVFGAKFQARMGAQKYFMVGAGAIGCELLKNFAMMGLGAGEGGMVGSRLGRRVRRWLVLSAPGD